MGNYDDEMAAKVDEAQEAPVTEAEVEAAEAADEATDGASA